MIIHICMFTASAPRIKGIFHINWLCIVGLDWIESLSCIKGLICIGFAGWPDKVCIYTNSESWRLKVLISASSNLLMKNVYLKPAYNQINWFRIGNFLDNLYYGRGVTQSKSMLSSIFQIQYKSIINYQHACSQFQEWIYQIYSKIQLN